MKTPRMSYKISNKEKNISPQKEKLPKGKIKNYAWYGDVPVIYDEKRSTLYVPKKIELKANNLGKKYYPKIKEFDLENENVTVEGDEYL